MQEEYFHDSTYDLYLSMSQIPDSGLGVYTNECIPKNAIIDEYVGTLTCIGGPYVVSIDDRLGIDGFEYPRCFMAMLNDASYVPRKTITRGRSKRKICVTPHKNVSNEGLELQNNCEFIVMKKRCFIKSTRDILPGEELFVSYGNSYWSTY